MNSQTTVTRPRCRSSATAWSVICRSDSTPRSSVTPSRTGQPVLESLEDVQYVDGGALEDLDPFAEAISAAERVGATTTSFVAHPATLLALTQLKVATDWLQPLLGTDPSSPTKRSIQGVPVQWSPAVEAGTVWAIPQAKVFVVLRLPASVVTDRSAYFSSDRTGIRCVLRVGFAFPHEQAIVKISPDGS